MAAADEEAKARLVQEIEDQLHREFDRLHRRIVQLRQHCPGFFARDSLQIYHSVRKRNDIGLDDVGQVLDVVGCGHQALKLVALLLGQHAHTYPAHVFEDRRLQDIDLVITPGNILKGRKVPCFKGRTDIL